MKVKVKCDHKDFNKINFGIHWRCSAASWIFDIFIGFWGIWKRTETPVIFKNQTQARFFWLFEQTTEPILIKILGKIEYDMPNEKPRRFGPISLKVKKLLRFTTQKFKMLLKWANRWRSRSNTFKDIYILLSLEFIGDVKLLFRFSISWLVLELWPNDWTSMTEFSVFLVFFSILLPPTDKNSKFCLDRIQMFTLSEFSWKFGLNWSCWFGESWLKKNINRRII